MGDNTFTAIDLGTTKIVVVRGKSIGEHKVEITEMGSYESAGVERGIVKNIEETSASIRKAMEQISTSEPIDDNVWVGIAGQHVRSTKSSPQIEFDNEEHVINFNDIEKLCRKNFLANVKPGEKVVNVAPQSFGVEEGLFKEMPIGKTSGFLSANMHLTIAQESSFNNINKSLKSNNIKTKELVLESIASAKSVLTKEEIKQGVVLIDIGGGTSDLVIFKDGTVMHSAVIPFGGESITQDIQQAFELDYKYARELKHQFGYTLKTSSTDNINLKNIAGQKIKIKQKDLSHVIKCRMEEIIDLIKFQLELSGYNDQLSRGFVLTGGGALLNDIMQLFAFHFNQAPIRIGRPNQQFISAQIDEDLNNPIYSTATGLLLFGMETQRLNEEGKKKSESLKEDEEEKTKDKHQEKASFFDSLRGRLKNFFIEEDQEI